MPEVSIVVPCYNEQATITLLLCALYDQTYPHQKMEIIIADALSTDQTRLMISSFQLDHADMQVHIVDNPKRTIPSALNEAIISAQGEYIVRLDAHCVPRPDYVERCIFALQEGIGMNVGGVWDIQPGKPQAMARAIAVAASHPLGVGDAHYRHTQIAQYTDTVPFGSFRRDLIQRIGLYDETLLANEDYEFNTRIRQAGGKIWLDPQICSTYYARADLVALAKQYYRYGYWKMRMLFRYPNTLRWRQALPPLFVLSLLIFAIASFFSSIALFFFLVEIALYMLILFLTSFTLAIKRQDGFLALGVPLAIATMHLAWGSGFLWSIFHKQ